MPSYTIIVDELDVLNGEYPLPLPDEMTNRELRVIKTMAGVRVGEIEDAMRAGDNDVMIAFAAIALRRAGKVFSDDTLWDAKTGLITVKEHKDAKDDAGPPAKPLSNEPDESKRTSGSSSSESGAASPETTNRNGSGTPDSDTGATFGPPTLVG